MTAKVNTNETTQIGRQPVEMRALRSGRLWCDDCARQVNVVTVDQASTVTTLRVELLLDRINNHTLHSRRSLNGGFLICLESLVRFSIAFAAAERRRFPICVCGD